MPSTLLFKLICFYINVVAPRKKFMLKILRQGGLMSIHIASFQ